MSKARNAGGKVLAIILLITGYGSHAAPSPDFRVSQLRCEYMENPLGIDVLQPRLSWRLESSERGEHQSAYRILVASSQKILNEDQCDLWDSGKVTSGNASQILYNGSSLNSSRQVFWKVKSWDRSDEESAWSQPANWTMGLLHESDWKAHWISERPGTSNNSNIGCKTLLLRRGFVLRTKLKRALIQIAGLGHYQITVNGVKPGADLLSPGWTKYDKTVLYDTYDISALLRDGTNAVGLVLGNGMYNVQGGRYVKFKGSFGPPKAIGLIRLEYTDNSVDEIGTDADWRTAPGAETFSCVYGGEDYDARLEVIDWEKPHFDDSGWETAAVVPGPGGQLRGASCAAAPIRISGILPSIRMKSIGAGMAVYDFGQNAALMPRLNVTGAAGTVVRMVPAELLKPDGTVDRDSVGGGQAYWQYTLAGRGAETWFPRFFYHGCRYLQVECTPPPGQEQPTIQSLEGVVVHSSAPQVGDFECSNPLFNRIRDLIRWAQRSNMMSVLTDCPHREKLGWLEQYHLNGPALRYNFDLSRLFTKAMNDMKDSQRENGLIPDIAPEYVRFDGGFVDSPEWGSAFVLVPWQQFEFSGDVELLRKYYTPMKSYLAYLVSRSTNHIVSHGLGDWYDIGPSAPGVAQLTPIPLTATAFYFYDTWVLSRVAALLGENQESRMFAAKAEEIRKAFNSRFFDPATSQYATGSQCANAIPLVMNIAETADRPRIVANLVADVRRHGNALTAGDVGYRFLLRALADAGRSDVIFEINNQSEKPGYGYQLKQGATSLTEAWDAGRSSSQNHFMLGQLMEWFYHDVAGIICDPEGPGFKRVIIKPSVVGDLTWAKASYDSIHGPIRSDWKRNAEAFTLDVTIPPGTSATVFVPASSASEITEGGAPAASSKGVAFLREDGRTAIYRIQSGTYSFKSRLPR